MRRDERFLPWLERGARQKLLFHDEGQTQAEAGFEDETQTVMEVLTELVPAIRHLTARYEKRDDRGSR